MTFDEWWVDQHGQNWRAIFTHSAKDAAREAWEAAFLDGYERGRAAFCEAVALEREACAKVCDELQSMDFCVDVRRAADAIRMRSNGFELTGAPLAERSSGTE